MASVETSSLKRQRDETHVSDLEENKKVKSFSHILSILDEDEEEPTQDLSVLMTTLQQELSEPNLVSQTQDSKSSETPNTDQDSSDTSNEEDDKERVMRHLLEASDDELGIPNSSEDVVGELVVGDDFLVCDGLWEFEDEAANYYTLLQSELFM